MYLNALPWQCVAGAMYITGFSESVAELLGLQSQWAVRGMSVAVLLGLLGINLAGVKWIVRLQLLLLAVLAVSTLDFVVGTFTHLDPGRVTGAGKRHYARTNAYTHARIHTRSHNRSYTKGGKVVRECYSNLKRVIQLPIRWFVSAQSP